MAVGFSVGGLLGKTVGTAVCVSNSGLGVLVGIVADRLEEKGVANLLGSIVAVRVGANGSDTLVGMVEGATVTSATPAICVRVISAEAARPCIWVIRAKIPTSNNNMPIINSMTGRLVSAEIITPLKKFLLTTTLLIRCLSAIRSYN